MAVKSPDLFIHGVQTGRMPVKRHLWTLGQFSERANRLKDFRKLNRVREGTVHLRGFGSAKEFSALA